MASRRHLNAIDMPFGWHYFFSEMTQNQFNNRFVKIGVRIKPAPLEIHKFHNEQLARRKLVNPVSKFGQVQFIYRLTDVERRKFKVEFNNPGVVAIIE